MGLIDDTGLRDTTKRTSARLFRGVKTESGFAHWKRFDKALARDLSLFFTGVASALRVTSKPLR